MNNNKKELFCYRCLKTITPYYKRVTSTYYFDVDNKQIVDLHPHCPICNNEVFDIDYHNFVIKSKKRIYFDRLKASGVVINEI